MEKKQVTFENSWNQMETFEVEDYETHIVIGRFISDAIEVVEVPDNVYGKPVTAIGDDCFFNCTCIKTIILPDTIEEIGVQAFAMCKALEEILFPESVVEIGHHAFRDCRSLKRVVLPSNLKRLPAGMFSFCYLDNPTIVLPEGLEVIESGAFWSAGTFNLVIPDSVSEIGVGAFNCGPHPITKLPEDKGWFLEWPYGEIVECSGVKGKITNLHFLENNCQIHEVTIGTEVKNYVYPCDYLDEVISFAEDNNQQRIKEDIEFNWRTESALAGTYKVRDAWKRGLLVWK